LDSTTGTSIQYSASSDAPWAACFRKRQKPRQRSRNGNRDARRNLQGKCGASVGRGRQQSLDSSGDVCRVTCTHTGVHATLGDVYSSATDSAAVSGYSRSVSPGVSDAANRDPQLLGI
jgi:hypothetical protein